MPKIASALLLLFASIAAPFCLGQTAQTAQTPQAKRPMTFEDMMQMKRLGETAVSPDGKWLAYSVTTVNLDQNTKTAELLLQAMAGGDPKPLAVAKPGDSGPQFASDGKRILFLSSRGGAQQIWVADFDTTTGATANPRRLTSMSTEAADALWSPDGQSIVFTSAVYPDCPAITATDSTGDTCNGNRDNAQAASKVKAQVFTHLLYRHWNHYTGAKRSHLFLVSVETGAVRDLAPNDPHDVPPFSLGGGGGFAFAPNSKELAFTENLDPEPAISTNADIFTLDLTNPAAKPVKVSTSLGGDFSPAYSPDGKYLAWRSEERPGYEADKFRLMLYDRKAKTIKDLLKDAKLSSRAPANFDNWVDEFTWIDDSKHILFVSGEKGEAPLYETNITGDDLDRLGKAAGEWGDIRPFLKNGMEVVAGTLVRVDRPTEFVLGDLVQMDEGVHVIPCSRPI